MGYNEPMGLPKTKGLHVFFVKKNFFIPMNFGTISFATYYNKCL
jgi:hypothetical protein